MLKHHKTCRFSSSTNFLPRQFTLQSSRDKWRLQRNCQVGINKFPSITEFKLHMNICTELKWADLHRAQQTVLWSGTWWLSVSYPPVCNSPSTDWQSLCLSPKSYCLRVACNVISSCSCSCCCDCSSFWNSWGCWFNCSNEELLLLLPLSSRLVLLSGNCFKAFSDSLEQSTTWRPVDISKKLLYCREIRLYNRSYTIILGSSSDYRR